MRAFCIAFVALAAFASAQPFPSFLLDTSRVLGPDSEDALRSGMAFADSVGLIAWYTTDGIRACRVTRGLQFIDSAPIALNVSAGSPDSDQPLGVASNGRSFLVAWVQSTWAQGIPGSTRCVQAVLVGIDGEPKRSLTLAPPSRRGRGTPAAASDGNGYVVTWVQTEDSSDMSRVMFARLASDGTPLDSPPRSACPRLERAQGLSDVAFGGAGYLIAWTTLDRYAAGTVACNVLTSSGHLLDSSGIKVCSDPDRPVGVRVTYDGVNFIVVHERYRDATLAAHRVTPGGRVLDTTGVLLVDTATRSSHVCSERETTLVAWSQIVGDTVWILARRFDRELCRLDSEAVRVSPGMPYVERAPVPCFPAVGAAGPDFVAMWAHPYERFSYTGNTDILARRVSRAGVCLDSTPVNLSRAATKGIELALASDGRDFFAAWTACVRESGSSQRVHGGRFTADGRQLDATAFKLGTAGSLQPAVAYGQGCYLVCWLDESLAVSARRVTPEGVLPDTAPIRICEGDAVAGPDVAYGGGVFLVVWWAVGGRTLGGRTLGARVTPDGVLLDSVPLHLQAEEEPTRRPAVASDGTDFLVARPHYLRERMLAVRVGADGSVLDTCDLVLEPGGGAAHVAFGGGVYLVLADDPATAWRVAPSGAVLDTAIHLSHLMSLVYAGYGVGFDGASFGVIASARNSSSGAVDMVRIAPSGVIRDTLPVRLVVDTDSGIRGDCAIATAQDGTTAAAFVMRALGRYCARRPASVVFERLPGGVLASEPGRPHVSLAGATLVAGSAVLRVSLSERAGVLAGLYDVTGRLARGLSAGEMAAGEHEVRVDLRGLPAGVYYARLGVGGPPRKLVIAR